MEWDACFLLTPVLKKKEEFPYVLAFFFSPFLLLLLLQIDNSAIRSD